MAARRCAVPRTVFVRRARALLARRASGFPVPLERPMGSQNGISRILHIEVGSASPMAEPVPSPLDDAVTTRDVTASGVRLRVVERGRGPKLVLLHSLFMDHSTWDAVAAELSQDYCVITPDLPGYGESEKPRSEEQTSELQ